MIPLIHNYCDRWCEHCTMTSQCSVYEKTSHLSEDDLDIKNENFWQFLQDTLEESMMLLQKKMEEMNIPPMTEEESIEFEKQEEQKDKTIRQETLLKICRNYNKAIEPFIKDYLEEKIKESVENSVRLNLAENQNQKLCNSYEIIQWYRYLIETKLFRALSGRYDASENQDEDYLYDSNGSAKIALISIERSLFAWKWLYDLFPEKEDEILDFMILLQKAKLLTEQTFPDANSFVRPGFDQQIENKNITKKAKSYK